MRTLYRKQDGTELQAGDTVEYVNSNGPQPATVVRLRNDFIHMDINNRGIDVYHSSFRTHLPSITIVTLPEVGYFNRITGERLRVGSVIAGGTVDLIIDDAIRFRREAGEEHHRFAEVDPSLENLEWGVEIRIHPSESELELGLTRIVRDGRYFVQIGGEDVPVEETVWLHGGYHRLADCHILRGLDRRPIVNTAGMRLLADGTYGLENECVTLSDGEVVHMLDCVPTADGRLIRIGEAVEVRNHHGETEYYSTRPDGTLELNGVLCWERHLMECGETGELFHTSECVTIENSYVSSEWASRHARTCEECGSWFAFPRCGGRRVPFLSSTIPNPNPGLLQPFGCFSAAGAERSAQVRHRTGSRLRDCGFSQQQCTEVMAAALDAAVGDVRNYAIFKSDGSLCDCNGFEIVTRPDCPSVHKRIWGEVLAAPDVPRYMSSFNNGKCGIHIHVSREPLTELWVGRLLVLVNEPEMQPLLHKIAGRGSNGYTVYNPQKKLTDGKELGSLRYEALNTSGESTIEFRIFRGTLNRGSFLKNIEFVEAALAFTRPAERSLREIGKPELFLDFVSKSRKDYPHLFGFLTNRGLCNK